MEQSLMVAFFKWFSRRWRVENSLEQVEHLFGFTLWTFRWCLLWSPRLQNFRLQEEQSLIEAFFWCCSRWARVRNLCLHRVQTVPHVGLVWWAWRRWALSNTLSHNKQMNLIFFFEKEELVPSLPMSKGKWMKQLVPPLFIARGFTPSCPLY